MPTPLIWSAIRLGKHLFGRAPDTPPVDPHLRAFVESGELDRVLDRNALEWTVEGAMADARVMRREKLMRDMGLGKQLDKDRGDLEKFRQNFMTQARLRRLSRDSSNTESGLNKLMYRIHRNKK